MVGVGLTTTPTFDLTEPARLAGLSLLPLLLLLPLTLVLTGEAVTAVASFCLALTLTRATSSMDTVGSAQSGRTGRWRGLLSPPPLSPPTDVLRATWGDPGMNLTLSLEVRRWSGYLAPTPPPVSITADFMALLLSLLLLQVVGCCCCWAWNKVMQKSRQCS